MSNIDFNVQGIDPGSGIARLGDMKGLYVEFYRGSRLNGAASEKAGTPIYDPVDRVKVIQPGERDVADYVVNETYKRKFARQWEAYQKNMEQGESGTPLFALFPRQPETVATLNAMHVHTVQQLAGMSDGAAQNIPFGGELVKKAKAYLDSAKQGEAYHALVSENEEKEARIRKLEQDVERLSAQLNDNGGEDSEPVRRGPGRPRKDQ